MDLARIQCFAFFILSLLCIPGAAQDFQMYELDGQPSVIWPGQALWSIVLQNRSSDPISSFSIHDIYSIQEPVVSARVAEWDYTFTRNPTNGALWDLHALTLDSTAYIRTNFDFFLGVDTSFPTNAYLLRTGKLENSVGFVSSGVKESSPSVLVGSVGWQNGPLLARIETAPTNGAFRLSWIGADAIYVEHKSTLQDDNWQILAGPLTGGSWVFTSPTNLPSAIFRFRLR